MVIPCMCDFCNFVSSYHRKPILQYLGELQFKSSISQTYSNDIYHHNSQLKMLLTGNLSHGILSCQASADLMFGGITIVCGIFGTLAGGFILDKIESTISNAFKVRNKFTY